MAESTAPDSFTHGHEASLRPPRFTLPPPGDPNPSPPAEGSSEEDDFYGDQDDAQSFIQPAISPVATRLTSPRTPAAEKVAAMDQIIGGYFDGAGASKDGEFPAEETPNQEEQHHGSASQKVGTGTKLPRTTSIPPPQPQYREPLPTPWRTGPKEIFVASSSSQDHQPAMASVLAQSRHRRSSSGGSEALRRWTKALPSISLPSNLMPNRFSVPSFFSYSSATSSKSDSRHVSPKNSPPTQSPRLGNSNHASTFPLFSESKPPPTHQTPEPSPNVVDRASTRSKKSMALRRSTSDDSLLYHSLSRMSSFGDDQRFTNIREQVNSRFKAIVDSFDPPTFKLPSMPSMPTTLLSPLKKTEFSSAEIDSELSRSASTRTVKAPRDSLDRVLESLTGDLVIMGGYRGSILRSAEPPHRQLWVPIKVGLNVRKVNLEVGLNPEDELKMEETIIPSGMLKNIGPIDISKRLFKRVRECENARTGKLRIHDYGYDWRLSPHILSRNLIKFLKTLPSNQGHKPTGAMVIAHSLGGVITRHVVNQQPQLFSGVVYAGTPQRCINILGPLRNGDAVLLNEKVLTAHVNFSLRTTFVFLPEDGCCFIDKDTNEEYKIDFYNPDDWVKYRLCPSVGGPALPPFSAKRSGPFGSFLNLSDSLSRGRSSSDPAARRPGHTASPQRRIVKSRILAPQMDASAAASSTDDDQYQQRTSSRTNPTHDKNLAYLTRTLAEVKRFRAELQHKSSYQSSNAYPPIAVIYGKEIPTVYATRVASREAIACSDVYEDLVFRSGDGVVLAREAMPPPGYEIVKGGRISTDKGHISILGDLSAVGRALESVIRGQRKGIGLGVDQ